MCQLSVSWNVLQQALLLANMQVSKLAGSLCGFRRNKQLLVGIAAGKHTSQDSSRQSPGPGSKRKREQPATDKQQGDFPTLSCLNA